MDAKVDVSQTVLETKHLILRPWKKEDVNDFFEYASVRGVGEMAGWSHHETISESEAILSMFIEHKKTFAVVLKANQKVIGSVGIESVKDHAGEELNDLKGREIGYVLSKDYWGQGLMAEAVRCVIDWCFHELNYDFLLCGNFVENRQSARVQQKAGFQPYRQIEYATSSQGIKKSEMRILMNPKKEK
ncbi:MAG: GNAT family N-acetyltransferase [Erysipelotrichaceae bacterium]|nr:GNAT family N-acetyltransferase [Erysipelotrichaceae bacterium]